MSGPSDLPFPLLQGQTSNTDDTNNDKLHSASMVCMTCLLLPAEASTQCQLHMAESITQLGSLAGTGYWGCWLLQIDAADPFRDTLSPADPLLHQAWATYPGRMDQSGYRRTRDC